MLAGVHSTPRVLRLQSQGTTRDVSLPAPDQSFGSSDPVSHAEIRPGIGLIRLNDSLGNDATVAAFDAALDALRGTRGLIVDLRNTASGGNSSVARGILGRFVAREMPYQKHIWPAEEKETGIRTTVTFGSSGSFFAQIQNGAPFDVFFSADLDYPRQLAASGHAEASSLYPFATGRIALWTRKDTGIDLTRGLHVLREARVRRIAIANPKVAPYGRAAVAAMRSAKVYEAAEGKLDFPERIREGLPAMALQ